jgi:hypothetical protein
MEYHGPISVLAQLAHFLYIIININIFLMRMPFQKTLMFAVTGLFLLSWLLHDNNEK